VNALNDADLIALIRERVPGRHVDFLRGFDDLAIAGGYAFVHAGLRPGVALDAQKSADLRWIREPFLGHRGSFGAVVVHGHTITDEVDERPNRIGIDTGASYSGRLTAIGLDGDRRWYLST
jgi:serine/threonine protein phosphatase 1